MAVDWFAFELKCRERNKRWWVTITDAEEPKALITIPDTISPRHEWTQEEFDELGRGMAAINAKIESNDEFEEWFKKMEDLCVSFGMEKGDSCERCKRPLINKEVCMCDRIEYLKWEVEQNGRKFEHGDKIS